MKCTVTRAFYDIGGRKYIDLDSVCVKVPFRYGRVMCKVDGIVPVQDIPVGTVVDVAIHHKMWDGIKYKVLESLSVKSSC
jgi:hypothetical protein